MKAELNLETVEIIVRLKSSAKTQQVVCSSTYDPDEALKRFQHIARKVSQLNDRCLQQWQMREDPEQVMVEALTVIQSVCQKSSGQRAKAVAHAQSSIALIAYRSQAQPPFGVWPDEDESEEEGGEE
jgi:hypothetical protein